MRRVPAVSRIFVSSYHRSGRWILLLQFPRFWAQNLGFSSCALGFGICSLTWFEVTNDNGVGYEKSVNGPTMQMPKPTPHEPRLVHSEPNTNIPQSKGKNSYCIWVSASVPGQSSPLLGSELRLHTEPSLLLRCSIIGLDSGYAHLNPKPSS